MTENIVFPAASGDWLAFVTTRRQERLTQVEALADSLKYGAERSTSETLEMWNDLQIALRQARSEADLLCEVHPDAEVRAAAEEGVTDVHAAESALMADAELAARDSELSLAFARNIRDGRREVRFAPEALDGLPEDFFAQHPVGGDGRIAVSTDNVDVMAVLNYARDRETRLAVRHARADLAWPANDAVLAELLDVRQQRADLLGYASWADYETETRMAGSAARVASFLDEVDAASKTASDAEYELLLARLRQDIPDAEAVTAADRSYLLNRLHEERYAVDALQVRRHLSFERVLGGLLSTTGRLFDIEYVPTTDPAWHEDVRSYDVVRAGERLGRIHLDLHPREGKYNHAACFPLAPGVRGRVLPEAALVCNFPRGLMEHREVQTFFHEFGHLVHEILGGDQEWVEFSGVATEWDFVEAPSQMLEEWVWDAEVLASFALDDAGVPISADLVARMREADAFGRALLVRTQLGHALVSYHLHMDRPADLAAATDHWYEVSAPFGRLGGEHSYAAFGHLTEYGSCYYTYQWSLVIARDLLTGFAGLMDPASATRYRQEILEPGGRRDAADLVESFLGRPFTVDAYREFLGSH